MVFNYLYAVPGLAGGALAGVVGVKILISTEEGLSYVRRVGNVPMYIAGATVMGLAGAVVVGMRR